METNPPGGHAVEGEILVLVCFMVEGTGITTFSWHREDTKESLGRKIQRSQRAELQISVIKKSDAGQYYCTADNSYGPIRSAVVNVIVKGKFNRHCFYFLLLFSVIVLSQIKSGHSQH